MDKLLIDKLPEIKALLKKHRVKRAYTFGSVNTSSFNESSDVDFLISFEEGLDPLVMGENWWSIYYSLQDIIKRNVDLVTESSLHNPYFVKVLEKTKVPIYE